VSNAIRWTPEQLAEYRARHGLTPREPAAPKREKYASEKTVDPAGEKFDSRKEARRWAQLKQMAAAGQIHDLKRQVSFVLAPSVKLDGEPRKKPAIRYFADYTYIQDGQLVVEDTKSRPTRKLAAYRIKKHLMATVHNIQIKET
jgi:hypothetical protein